MYRKTGCRLTPVAIPDIEVAERKVEAGVKYLRHLRASMRTRQSLSELIEGRLASPDGRAELARLATRLIVEEALEAECRDALGRDYYERGAEECRGYRNGVRTGRLKTAEGLIDFAAPQVAGC